MDGPSLQLQGTLNSSIREALLTQRPILTHLNADTTWLLQLPYPSDAARPPGRSRFNIVLDPWFQGQCRSVRLGVIGTVRVLIQP